MEAYADTLGMSKGVTGYIYPTSLMAIFAWLRHYGDFRATLESVLSLGGDTDTVGAIAGGLAGATTGVSGIPTEWVQDICDWPISVTRLQEVASALAAKAIGSPQRDVSYAWYVQPLRNLLFTTIVIGHGFRRLLPPYR